jgi:hypothetical protein
MASEPSQLAAALAKVQEALPHIAKGEKANVGQYSYEYADLTAVSAAILPLLGKHGLAFIAKPTAVDGKFVLAYSLLHSSGERRCRTRARRSSSAATSPMPAATACVP